MFKTTIETKRLWLRPFKEEDLEDFYAYAKVPGVGERAGWPHHQNIEDSKVILQAFIEGGEVLALVDKATQKVIGSIGLHQEQPNTGTLGYVLAKSHWHQGLMSEAAEAFVQYIVANHLVDRIEVAHFMENLASRRIIEKLGFRFTHEGPYISNKLQKTFKARYYVLEVNAKAQNSN